MCMGCKVAVTELDLLQGKGIATLVQQLCSLEVPTACHAACVVANMAACGQAHYHDALLEVGALMPLVELLKCSLDEQSAALGALRNLTADTIWQVPDADSNPLRNAETSVQCKLLVFDPITI